MAPGPTGCTSCPASRRRISGRWSSTTRSAGRSCRTDSPCRRSAATADPTSTRTDRSTFSSARTSRSEGQLDPDRSRQGLVSDLPLLQPWRAVLRQDVEARGHRRHVVTSEIVLIMLLKDRRGGGRGPQEVTAFRDQTRPPALSFSESRTFGEKRLNQMAARGLSAGPRIASAPNELPRCPGRFVRRRLWGITAYNLHHRRRSRRFCDSGGGHCRPAGPAASAAREPPSVPRSRVWTIRES